MSRMTTATREALGMIQRHDARYRAPSAAATSETFDDRFTAFIHWRTAEALERRGLIRIARDEEWAIYLTEAGKEAASTPDG